MLPDLDRLMMSMAEEKLLMRRYFACVSCECSHHPVNHEHSNLDFNDVTLQMQWEALIPPIQALRSKCVANLAAWYLLSGCLERCRYYVI
jgi:hypothetical protein